MSAEKPRRLGRGLDALIAAKPAANASAANGSGGAGLQTIKLSQIRPNPYQPRREFRPEELADLEASLKASGLLQPITVRRVDGGFELIAGERRFRAATRLGWAEIPAIVREIDDRTMLTLALVENLQRADLNPLEEAEGYQRLIDEFDLTQQQVADAVGKDRSTVANFLRVLQLPEAVRGMLRDGQITMGHARALLGLEEEDERVGLARDVVEGQLSVRETEQRVRQINNPTPATPVATPERPAGGGAPRGTPELPPAVRRIQDQLRKRLQTDVAISLDGEERGKLRVSFYSADDLERLLDLILGSDRSDFD